MSVLQNDNNSYFAAREAKACASVLMDKSSSFFNYLKANAYLEKIQNMWRMYYGTGRDNVGYGHSIDFTGEQGELVSLPVNHFRNLAQHIYVMITANRPIMESRAVNNDYKSLSQTYLANGILEYYMREKRLEDCLKKAVELSICTGTGYVKLEWNATAGEAYDVDPETGEFSYEGELEFSNLSALDVVVDGTKETWDNDWLVCRTFKNKYDLMAKFPEVEMQIRSLPSKSEGSVGRLGIFTNDDTDDIPVYEFYHRKTESMPDGRYLLYLSEDIILLDTKMPYRNIPVFRIVPSEILGTPYGYTPMFDIFPIQEGINALYSTILTNQNAFGVQNLYVPRGADLQVSSLSGGMNIIEANAKPEALNLTETPAEVFKFLEMLIATAETISGVNSVARGTPPASLESGTALALIQSMSLQFMSGLQQSYVKLIEDVGTSIIRMLQDFAMSPKIVAIVGKDNRTFLKEFTGENIAAINRVVVDVGNPLSRTIAGRVQMAEQMMQMQIIKTPQQYFQVLNTGRLESMIQGEEKELLNIQSENERLMEGIQVLVAPTDRHTIHINEHKSVIDDPDLRNDPALVKIVMDHIQDHLNALRNTDPALLQMLGQQPLPPLESMIEQPLPQEEQGVPEGLEPNSEVLAPDIGLIQPRNPRISGPGVEDVGLPDLPKPPGEFKTLPVTADQMSPQPLG